MKAVVVVAMVALLMGGCATRMIQDVRIEEGVLIVKDCILENGGTFENKCVEHRYPVK